MISSFLSNLFNKNINNPKNRYSHKKFFQNSEHQTLLDVKEKKHLAEGSSGEISKAQIEFSKPSKNGVIISKNKSFILKSYDDKKNRDKVYDNWKLLHQLKFNTFTTYRKFEKTQILMTNLSTQTQFCTSSNNLDNSSDAKYLIQNNLIKINNFESLLDSTIIILQKAKQYDIHIDYSAYFFIGNKDISKTTDLEILIGDLDYISKGYSRLVQHEIFDSINAFIIFFVEKPYQQKYFNLLTNKFKNLKI